MYQPETNKKSGKQFMKGSAIHIATVLPQVLPLTSIVPTCMYVPIFTINSKIYLIYFQSGFPR